MLDCASSCTMEPSDKVIERSSPTPVLYARPPNQWIGSKNRTDIRAATANVATESHLKDPVVTTRLSGAIENAATFLPSCCASAISCSTFNSGHAGEISKRRVNVLIVKNSSTL